MADGFHAVDGIGHGGDALHLGLVDGQFGLAIPGKQFLGDLFGVVGLADQANHVHSAGQGAAQAARAVTGGAIGVHVNRNLVEGIANIICQLANQGIGGAAGAAAFFKIAPVAALFRHVRIDPFVGEGIGRGRNGFRAGVQKGTACRDQGDACRYFGRGLEKITAGLEMFHVVSSLKYLVPYHFIRLTKGCQGSAGRLNRLRGLDLKTRWDENRPIGGGRLVS